jgi:hypothetical protein
LNDGELNVSGSWRKVQDEIVERRPGDLAEKLLGVASDHRTAKDCGRTVVEQEAHRHEFQALPLYGQDPIFIISHRAFIAPEHQCNAWAVEVAVTEAYA